MHRASLGGWGREREVHSFLSRLQAGQSCNHPLLGAHLRPSNTPQRKCSLCAPDCSLPLLQNPLGGFIPLARPCFCNISLVLWPDPGSWRKDRQSPPAAWQEAPPPPFASGTQSHLTLHLCHSNWLHLQEPHLQEDLEKTTWGRTIVPCEASVSVPVPLQGLYLG